MTRLRGPALSTRAFVGLGLLAVLIGVYAISRISETAQAPPPTISLRAVGYERTTLYRSPQEPGYTSWTGAWIMPDGSLMTAFTQATGPLDPAQRGLVSPSVLRKMDLASLEPERDFWGLDLSVKYLRSSDGGRTWKPFRTDAFTGLTPHAYTPQATTALPDGTIVRRVNGDDLRFDDSIPHTAYLQRLAPGARDWSEPQVLLDPAEYTYQVSRLRRLRDGRLIALGGVWNAPADSPRSVLDEAPGNVLLMVSSDEGKTWQNGLTVSSDGPPPTGEWDAAELENGDLLAVFRTRDPANPDVEVRRQALLEKDDSGWELSELREAPFPHSGHPELLATREGPILHLASTGAHYTADGGETWTPLRFSPKTKYGTRYYPRAVQAADGTVYVFSHVGADDDYGEEDQSIVMDRFRLKVRRISR